MGCILAISCFTRHGHHFLKFLGCYNLPGHLGIYKDNNFPVPWQFTSIKIQALYLWYHLIEFPVG